MSAKPICPLRQRMLEDMTVRRFTPDTQREYIRAVKRLATFLGRSRDSAEELRSFQLHLTATDVRPPTINATVTALRFFVKVTLDRPETTRHLVFVYEPRKLPRVLSPDEVLRLLEAAPGPKHKGDGTTVLAATVPCEGTRLPRSAVSIWSPPRRDWLRPNYGAGYAGTLRESELRQWYCGSG